VINEEIVGEIRQRCIDRGFMPSPQVVRVVLEEQETRVAAGVSNMDVTTLAGLLRELHPQATVRKETVTGVETDHHMCTWCMVEWPCPTVAALDDLTVSVDAG